MGVPLRTCTDVCVHTTCGASTESALPIHTNTLETHLLRRPLPRTQESSAHAGCVPSPSHTPFPSPLHNMPSKHEREDALRGWEGGYIKAEMQGNLNRDIGE